MQLKPLYPSSLIMDTVEITKKLISIPSYVGRGCNEKNIGDFIFNYLKDLNWLTVIRQKVEGNRENIIAYDTGKTRFLVCDHMDSVQPQSGWYSNPFKPRLSGNKLFGLGSTDTKGNLACILSAIANIGPTKEVMYLFYIDEE